MRTITKALSITLLSGVATLAIVGAASAQDSTTVYGGLYSNYPYQDLGVAGSDGPVAQGGVTANYGKLSIDGWVSVGERDEHKGANEIDLTATYTESVKTPIGTIVIAASAAYYAFDFQGLDTARDDAWDVHVDASLPIKIGEVTVAPFFRATRIGFVDGGGIDFQRHGVRISGNFTDKLSGSMELSESMNKTDDVDTTRAQFDLNYNAGNGLTINVLRLKLTDRLDPMVGVGFTKTR